jgi:DNA invertase Pin-like site-specific DNA recombinase
MVPAELPTAGYYRVSQARDDMKAPELYRDEIECYWTYRRLNLAEVFSDIDRSGFRGAKPRPALEELKRRSLEFSTIIVPKLARFGRSVKDLVQLFEFFDRTQVALVYLDMNIDTSTSQGRLLRHIMAAFAEYESDVKADYARANHRLARSKGLPWGLPPFGYVPDRTNRTYVISKPEAAMVRTIFQNSQRAASPNIALRGSLTTPGSSAARPSSGPRDRWAASSTTPPTSDAVSSMVSLSRPAGRPSSTTARGSRLGRCGRRTRGE